MSSDINLDDIPERYRYLIPKNPTPRVIESIRAHVKAMESEDEEEDDEKDLFKPHILVAPLLEPFLVRVQTSNTEFYSSPCQVYGRICFINGLGESFDIYHRERDNPEIIDPRLPTTLSLCGPNAGIVPVTDVILEIDLKDKSHDDAVIAKGDFVLDYKNRDYGVLDVLCAHGSHQSCSVHFSIFPFAVIATIEVSFFFKDDTDHNNLDLPFVVDVYGSVVARAHSGQDIMLFNKLKSHLDPVPLGLTSGICIELSRSVVAVPAYASLQIESKFNDFHTDAPIVVGAVEFEADDCFLNTKDVPGKNCFIRVQVQWSSAYKQPYCGKITKRSSDDVVSYGGDESGNVGNGELARELEPNSLGHDSEIPEQDKKLRLDSNSCTPSSSAICLTMEKEEPKQLPTILVEVFSVVVGSKDFKSLDIYGTIEVGTWRPLHIFNRDQDHPETCSLLPGKLKSVLNPRRCFFLTDNFTLRLELKDRDRLVGKGCMVWRNHNLNLPIRWYNRRLCSVFRGHVGYAVVHYSIFVNAVQAKVSVVLASNNSSTLSALISGHVVALYSSHTYSTSYEKKYYCSVLFDEDQETTYGSSQLPLSKDVLPVPTNSSLIVEVKLLVSGEALEGSLTFEINDTCVREIKSQNYDIKVCVPSWKAYRSWR